MNIVTVEEVREKCQNLHLPVNENDGWSHLVSTVSKKSGNKINVWKRPVAGNPSLTEYQGRGEFVARTAHSLAALAFDVNGRKAWDEHTLEVRVVEMVDGAQVVYWVVKFPWPMSDRDYIFCRRIVLEPDGSFCVVSRGIEHPSIPIGRKYTRVDPFESRLIFRDLPNGNTEWGMHYFQDIKSSIPDAIIRWVTKKAIPESVEKMWKEAPRYLSMPLPGMVAQAVVADSAEAVVAGSAEAVDVVASC